MLRWLTIAGAALALAGSFVIVADYWRGPVRNVLNRISGFDKAESGWEQLHQFERQDENGKVMGMPGETRMLGENDTGFRKILHIILNRRSEYRDRQISEIVCITGMGYELGETIVPQRYIALLREGRFTPDVVATSEQVEGWISEERTRFVLLSGFLLLLVGFLLSFPASICQACVKVE